MVEIKINRWVAWRIYSSDTECNTLILNQKENLYYVMNTEQTHIWQGIVNNTYSPQDVPFIAQLIKLDIISTNNISLFYNTCAVSVVAYEQIPSGLLNWINSLGYIFDIHWDVTHRCNANCIHCYNRGYNKKGITNIDDELTTRECFELLDQLAEVGVFRLVLSGGEPTLRKDFYTISEYAKDLGFQLIIYTNAISYSQLSLNKVVGLYPSTIAVSIYGDREDVHDMITNIKGSYVNAMYFLDYISSKQIYTCHKNTLLKQNYKYWQQTLIKGRCHASESMLNYTSYPSIDDSTSIDDYSMTFVQLVELASNKESPIYHKLKLKKDCRFDDRLDAPPCYAKTNSFYISPNGEFYPCIAMPYPIASYRRGETLTLKVAREEVPMPIFNKQLDSIVCVKKWIKNWRRLKISDLDSCGRYDFCDLCTDLCPGDAYVFNKNLLSAPVNHCIVAIARYVAHKLEGSKKTINDILGNIIDNGSLVDKNIISLIAKCMIEE